MKTELRIHIAALGFLDSRIYTPAIKNKADGVYLLRYPKEKNEDALKALTNIKKHLKEANISLIEVPCDIFDVTSVVKIVKDIIKKENENHIYLNVSSGNTISSNAFTLAAMIYRNLGHHIRTYYASFDYSTMKTKEDDIKLLPSFNIHIPDQNQCQVILLLHKEKEGLKKSQILDQLDPVYSRSKRDYKSKKLMNLNRQIIDKLRGDWDMLIVKGKSKNSTVFLTENGREFAEFIAP